MASSSSSRSWKYDVFLSFRGEDTRKTFVDPMYKALDDGLIHTYKDDITLARGESVGPALLKAVKESRHAAENRQIVMPIFYDVDPSDIRKQKRKFGKAFAKQEAENVTKAGSWRKALVDASNISGWELKDVASGYEAAVIQKIVNAISDNLLSSNSDIDKELVGMTDRVKDMISKFEFGTGGVRMVGIWGVGGGGKTTLATSVYMKIKDRFQEVQVQSEEEGKHMIRNRLCRSNVLILLDDVDNRKQLEALVGSHSWFGDGSRIIIITRNEYLLKKVDYVFPATLLSKDEGNWLFEKYAYNDKKPLKDYWKLSLRVVSYDHGLPLA
ncbi:Toll/interleukin-1 receptor domain-containing protein [Tanacetum coccineum]